MAFRSRPATPKDHDAFARLFAELGLDDPVPDARTWSSTWMTDSLFVEDDTGEIAGYGWGQVLGAIGYVRHVITAANRRREGVGMFVMNALRRRFVDAGCTSWRLNVITDNHGAIALYERCGMSELFKTTVLRLDWCVVRRIAPGERPGGPTIEIRDLGPEEEDGIAVRCGIESGLLPKLRREADAVVVGAFDGDRPIGVLRFDPAFPGARPVRADDPGVAAAMLAAVAERLPPGSKPFQIVVEDDARLASALEIAGADVRMRLALMEGRL